MTTTTSGSRISSLLLLFPLTVAAQHTPEFELFGGYSYLRLAKQSNLSAANLNGWNASVKLNAMPRIGLLADFSGHYGQRGRPPYTLFLAPREVHQIEPKPGNMRQHTFLFGPELRLLGNHRFTINVRALVGVAHRNTIVLPLREPIERPPDLFGNPRPPITQLISPSVNLFAASFGGSVDYRITDRLSYRIIQPELLLTRSSSSAQPDVRVSTGIVFTSGKSASRNSFGRRLSFGVIGGASLTDDVGQETTGFIVLPNGGTQTIRSRYYSTSRDYIIGPMIEFGLPWRLSVEIDGLYRLLNFKSAAVLPDGSLNSISPNPVVTWEFPILATYKLSSRTVKPFIELGPSFRSSGNLNGTVPSTYGGTLGLGIETHVKKLKVAPVVRYTHWAADGEFAPRRTKRNQAEFLVGFSF